MLHIHQFPCLNDNYGFLAHDPASGETAAIDTPDADKYLAEAKAKGWTITQIWNTHWHPDHAGGNEKIKAETGCTIIAPAGEAEKIKVMDRAASGGDIAHIGRFEAKILDTPGHTSGHISYYLPIIESAFVGDVLFALGCGRLFEGTPQQMWTSLLRLRSLPDTTTIYCAHEYTAANAEFAKTIEPDNPYLQTYIEEITAKRAAGKPTIPTNLAREMATNPFLRADNPALQTAMGHPDDATNTFAEIRARKDSF